MGALPDILRIANERHRRIAKARTAYAALTYEEKGFFVAEAIHELKTGPPKKRRAHRRVRPVAEPPTNANAKKTVRELVTGALSQHAPLSSAGVHAVIERTAPGVVSKGTVAAEVSVMLSKGLLVKAGVAGRGASFALANGRGGAH